MLSVLQGVLPPVDYMNIGGGVHHLNKVEPGWGVLIEFLLTFLLVFTVIMAAVNSKTKTSLAPLAIGFTVVVDILAG